MRNWLANAIAWYLNKVLDIGHRLTCPCLTEFEDADNRLEDAMERIEVSAEDADKLRAQASRERLERPALADVMLGIADQGIELTPYQPYDKIRGKRVRIEDE